MLNFSEKNYQILLNIFKRSSTNYYNSSLFFPKKIRHDVTTLYAFVRVVDDLVDQFDPKIEEFKNFKKSFFEYPNIYVDNIEQKIVIEEFQKLFNRKSFKQEWIIAFFRSMEMDFDSKEFKNLNDLEDYMYGSAVVIGFMMTKILNLKDDLQIYAKNLANGMQLGNFIRDIGFDFKLNRIYMPSDLLKKYNIYPLSLEICQNNQENFKKFLEEIANIYFSYMSAARKGFKFLPFTFRIAIKTSTDMYDYSVEKVLQNPITVFETVYKPSKNKVLFTGLKNIFLSMFDF